MSCVRANIRLALEAAEREVDGMGGFVLRWRRLGWLWAAMDAGAGRVRGAGAGPESVVRWRITVRGVGEGDPRRPVAGQRFRLGGRLFHIQAVAERDGAGRWLDCFATEETGI